MAAFRSAAHVYINGIKIDAAAVMVSAVSGGRLTFEIQVVPIPEWARLPVRSHAAVFFDDPVTGTRRLMCEGDYIGRARSGTGGGQYSTTLSFLGLAHRFETVSYANIVATVSDPAAPGITRTMIAMGQPFSQSTALNLPSINELTSRLLSTDQLVLSTFFRSFIGATIAQSPVESFYHAARQVAQKMYAVDDVDIKGALTAEIFQDLIVNGINQFGLGYMTPLGEMVSRFEQAMFYSSHPILAPPAHSDVMTELLFSPFMFGTIPPNCNVIFRDQIEQFSEHRNLASIPTRAIVSTTLISQQISMYFYNGLDTVTSVTEAIKSSGQDGTAAATHGAFSPWELEQGVVPAFEQLAVEKIGSPPKRETPDTGELAALQKYIDFATRYHYGVSRGAAQSMSLQCAFLPYIIPGLSVLVEHPTGPILGLVQSVSHTMMHDGTCSTSVQISHVQDMYIGAETPPMPTWMNSVYLPSKINSTFDSLFGATSIAGVAPPRGKAVTGWSADTVDMPLAASAIIAIPRYTTTGMVREGGGVADSLRRNPSDSLAFLRYQYRPGVSISSYLKFHNLPGSPGSDDWSPDATHELFAAPTGLEYTGVLGQYGIYKPIGTPTLSDRRQSVTRHIAHRQRQGGTFL